MEKIQLIQATLVGAHERADRLLYLMRIDLAHIRKTHGAASDEDVLAEVTRAAQTAITSAFPQDIVVWETPVDFDLEPPEYDPVLQMDGASVWILPVVSKSEMYFYLVG